MPEVLHPAGAPVKALVACEYSGRVREALRARGWDAISCDLLPSEDNSPHHIIGDVFDVIRDHGPFDLMIAHPPCTFLTNAGVRWLFEDVDRIVHDPTTPGNMMVVNGARWDSMFEGAQFFARLLVETNVKKVAIENPIMHRYARAAIEGIIGRSMNTHYVQPWWFGDRAFKATGFTTVGLDPLVEDPALTLRAEVPKPGTPEHKDWSKVHRASPGPNRWKERSRTFQGIADAIAKQWG